MVHPLAQAQTERHPCICGSGRDTYLVDPVHVIGFPDQVDPQRTDHGPLKEGAIQSWRLSLSTTTTLEVGPHQGIALTLVTGRKQRMALARGDSLDSAFASEAGRGMRRSAVWRRQGKGDEPGPDSLSPPLRLTMVGGCSPSLLRYGGYQTSMSRTWRRNRSRAIATPLASRFPKAGGTTRSRRCRTRGICSSSSDHNGRRVPSD